MKRRLIVPLCSIALTLALSACGGTPGTIPGPTSSGGSSSSPSATPMESPDSTETPTPTSSENQNVTVIPTPTPESSVPPAKLLKGDRYDWLDRGAAVTFGGEEKACFLAIQDVRVGLNDISVALVPRGTGTDIDAFLASEHRLPAVQVSTQTDSGVLFIQMKNTVLDTGDPVESAGNDDWVFDFIEEHGLIYPSVFPRGGVGEDNRFFHNAAISTDGTDTTLTLMLSDKTQRMRIESGSLDSEGVLPYFRLVFAETAADSGD